jgi:hypothetical protein
MAHAVDDTQNIYCPGQYWQWREGTETKRLWGPSIDAIIAVGLLFRARVYRRLGWGGLFSSLVHSRAAAF